MTNKIDREDMLALTRRMNVARSSFTRIAGCYLGLCLFHFQS